MGPVALSGFLDVVGEVLRGKEAVQYERYKEYIDSDVGDTMGIDQGSPAEPDEYVFRTPIKNNN